MVMLETDPMSMEFIEKKCSVCGNMRKFVKGTPRDKKNICGNCWDWEKEPSYLKLTPDEADQLKKLLEKEKSIKTNI